VILSEEEALVGMAIKTNRSGNCEFPCVRGDGEFEEAPNISASNGMTVK
jgi:hypothetical protein